MSKNNTTSRLLWDMSTLFIAFILHLLIFENGIESLNLTRIKGKGRQH